MFGFEHRLLYKSERTYKTCIGGCFTLLTIVVSTFGFVFFGKEIILKNNPIIVTSEKQVEQSKVSLKKLGLIFALIDTDGTYLHLDPMFLKNFQITPMMLNFDSEEGKVKLVPDFLFLETCKAEFFETEAYEMISKKLDIATALCLNPNKAFVNGKLVEEEQFFYDDYSQIGSRSLWFNMRLCDEKQNPGCRKWIDFNKDFFFVTNYVDYYYDGSDYESPIKSRLKTFNNLVGTGLASLLYNQIINKEAFLDSGIMFQNIEEIQYTSYYNSETQFQSFDPYNPNVFDLFFSSPKIKMETSRRYAKVQEVIADVGGFIKAIMMVFGYIGKVIGEYFFYNEYEEVIKLSKRKTLHAIKRSTTIRKVDRANVNSNVDKVVIRRNEDANQSNDGAIPKEEKNEQSPEHFTQNESKRKGMSFFTFFISMYFVNYGLKRGLNKAETFKFFDIEFISSKFNELDLKIQNLEGTN